MASGKPLIVSISMEPAWHKHFTRLRTLYFPAWCNHLEAHITLFHQLPGENEMVVKALENAALRTRFPMHVCGVRKLGNGVAFDLQSEELQRLHAALQEELNPFLISQDRKKLWPHITVQNKVTAYKALETARLIGKSFQPFTIPATGLSVWRYAGGPWQHMSHLPFHGGEATGILSV